MKLKNPMLVVPDLERSKAFYREVLGLRVTLDFGANVTLSGGLCLQTRVSWMEFLHKEKQEIRFGGCDGEIYLETEDLDAFLEKLPALCVELVHPPYMHRWGAESGSSL